ncbi:MAG: hypothetical protein PHV34_04985 [Verrucomicrobiae bacterium]|nr:hypothetical protein [Verrucomicrobiae bacterium]
MPTRHNNKSCLMNHRYLNVFLSYGGLNALTARMVDAVLDKGLRLSLLVFPEHLRQPECQADLRRYRDDHGVELVLWVRPDEPMLTECKIEDEPGRFPHFDAEAKPRLAKAMAELYLKALGTPLTTVAAGALDGASLRAIKQAAPTVIGAMGVCFEEGINVTHGHRYFNMEWVNWMEGSPWWPWIPRRNNAFVPAGAVDQGIGIACVPHLSRDLMLSYDSRNDFFSSEPMDEMRSKSVWKGDVGYTKRFFEQYMSQAELNNGYAYYQFLEFEGNFKENTPHVFDENPEEFIWVYGRYLAFLGEQVRDKVVQSVSLAEFCEWYLNQFHGVTPPTVAHWQDIRRGSKRSYIWYLDSKQRVLLAPSQGGAVLDLRPYVADIQKDLGPDSSCLWDGSHPFLIQHHHRYTSMAKCLIRQGDHVVDLSHQILAIEKIVRTENELRIRYASLALRLGDFSCQLVITTTIDLNGTISTSRRLINPSRAGIMIEFYEYVRGTWGTTDLPVSIAGIGLEVANLKERHWLTCAHRGKMVQLAEACQCRVCFSHEGFAFKLETDDKDCVGVISEGTVIQTFYEMALWKRVEMAAEAELSSRLRVCRECVECGTESPLIKKRSRWPKFPIPWGPTLAPLRCPRCLVADREVHLQEQGEEFLCSFCGFSGDAIKIESEYRQLRMMK